jgi:hypothetical protein
MILNILTSIRILVRTSLPMTGEPKLSSTGGNFLQIEDTMKLPTGETIHPLTRETTCPLIRETMWEITCPPIGETIYPILPHSDVQTA